MRAQLLDNARRQEPVRGTEDEIDFPPVVKLFNPVGAGTWLLTELEIENPDITWGLYNLGVGCPKIGTVSIAELAAIPMPLALGIERDLHFKADRTLLDYARVEWKAGRIVA